MLETTSGRSMLRPYRVSGLSPIWSVPRQRRIHVHRPRIDPAAQAAHLREARRLQDLERLERARPVVAMRHHLAVPVQLAEAVRQLTQRNEHGAVDVRDLVLVRLTHVDHEQIGVPVPFTFELLRRDLCPVVRRLGPDAAERLVVDQLRHARMLTAYGAVRVLLQLELPELELERVEQHQTADERVPGTEDQLDGLQRLDGADDPGKHAEHAALGARRHESRRRRFGVQAAVARALCGVEHRRLPLEAENRAVHVRLPEQHAGIVYEVAGREVVGPVRHDVELADDVEGVLRGEARLERLDPDVGVQVPDALGRRLELRLPHRGRAVDDLALQVRLVHHVEVDEADGPYARGREVERGRGAESARADEQHARGLELALPLHPHVRQDQVTRVPQNLLVRQLGQRLCHGRASGAAQDDGDRVAGPHRRLLLGELPDVPVVHIDVHKTARSEEHTSELQSLAYLVCRLLLEKKKINTLLYHLHSLSM